MIDELITDIDQATAWVRMSDKTTDNIDTYIQIVDEKLSRLCMEVDEIAKLDKKRR